MTDVVLKLKPSERRALVARLRALEDDDLARQAADEIENLAERLEVSHVYSLDPVTGAAIPEEMPDSSGHLDGIACRDITIKMLEGHDDRD